MELESTKATVEVSEEKYKKQLYKKITIESEKYSDYRA